MVDIPFICDQSNHDMTHIKSKTKYITQRKEKVDDQLDMSLRSDDCNTRTETICLNKIMNYLFSKFF